MRTLVQAMMLLYQKYGFDSKQGQLCKEIVDRAIYNSNTYILETNQEYMNQMRKKVLEDG